MPSCFSFASGTTIPVAANVVAIAKTNAMKMHSPAPGVAVVYDGTAPSDAAP